MQDVELRPHVKDQLRILYLGRFIGLCGTKPNMPVNFLVGHPKYNLTAEEKAKCIQHVRDAIGEVKRTPQTQEAWDVIDRASTGSE